MVVDANEHQYGLTAKHDLLTQLLEDITYLLVIDTGPGTSDLVNLNNVGDNGTTSNETRAWNLTKASLVGQAMTVHMCRREKIRQN